MIDYFNRYLQKHPPFTKFKPDVIQAAEIVVVIPVYLEDELKLTLNSLDECLSINKPVAVLLIVNLVTGADKSLLIKQQQAIDQINAYKGKSTNLRFYAIEAFDLPRKHFGAGLARKIGMDLAVQHFLNTNNLNGIIVSLDADSLVAPNYFQEIEDYFKNVNNKACSIYFEHPLGGEVFSQEIFDAITQYELHLRYYVECLRYINFPYAYHTVGSCFACRALSYVSVGGMNRRQGGEEFYFIQKLLQQGGYGEVNSTTVYPSPRISTRVPFGTGPSVKKIVEDKQPEYLTYNLQVFLDLKQLFDAIEDYYKISEEKYQEEILSLPGRVRSFLLNSDFFNELKPVNDHCSNIEVFKKRFYHVFNAFKLVKYLNYTHEHFLEKTPVFDASIELLELKGFNTEDIFEDNELLITYRNIQNDRNKK